MRVRGAEQGWQYRSGQEGGASSGAPCTQRSEGELRAGEEGGGGAEGEGRERGQEGKDGHPAA